MANDYNFNTNTQPNLAAPVSPIDFKPLMQFAQAGQPTKQQASTNPQQLTPQQQSQLNARQLGANLGAALNRMMQGPQQPQQLQPQQSVAPPNNVGSPFNVTGGLY